MKPYCCLLVLTTLSSGLLVSFTYAQSPPIETLEDGSATLAQATSQNSSDRPSYTGIVAEIDQIAQQITVRIDSFQNGNGSGVIIAKEGNTYYVLTASHVIKNPDQYKIGRW
jgi:S1-C subfamily serine protease